MFKTWGMLKFLRDNWEGPIVLKGIQSVEDALLAMENGMDGIVVSNHGAFNFSLKFVSASVFFTIWVLLCHEVLG